MKKFGLILVALLMISPQVTLGQSGESSKAEGLDATRAAKAEAVGTLRLKAKRVSEEIGKIASSEQFPNSDEGIQLMRQLLDELEEINRKLSILTTDVEDLKGWVDGQRESLPKIASEVDQLKQFRFSLYSQLQLRHSDRTGLIARDSSFYGMPFVGNREVNFSLRRTQFGFNYQVDPKTSIRASFDGSTGTLNQSFELRDLQMIFLIADPDVGVGTELFAGRQAIPIGYENARSSASREFPEHAIYNRVLFPSERTYSVYLRQGISNRFNSFFGVGNSLTVNDPENTSQAKNNQAALFGGVRYETPKLSVGLSHFSGSRGAFITSPASGSALSVPESDRNFTFVDATVLGVAKGVAFRGEAFSGRDRLPIGAIQAEQLVEGNPVGVKANSMSGYHLQASFSLDWRNLIFARIEGFDPNTKTPGNAMSGLGVGYRYSFNPGVTLALTLEQMKVPQLVQRKTHSIYTLRYQYRF